MASGSKFRVVEPGLRSSVDDWHRAMNAPASELPPLNPAQKEMAKRLQMNEEEYQRGYLAGLYGQQRTKERAEKLGRIVQEILSSLGADFELLGVKNDFDRDLWIFRVRKIGDSILDVPVPEELGSDLLDSDLPEYKNNLRKMVLRAIGG